MDNENIIPTTATPHPDARSTTARGDRVRHVRDRAAKEQHRMILLIAKYISIIFKPLFLPVMGLVALFLFTDLRAMPWLYQFMVLMVAYCFTFLLPTTLIALYTRHRGWPLMRLLSREERYVPYAISLLCYMTCYYIMIWLHMPHIMSSIVIAAIAVQLLCATINHFWKISAHTAAIGGTSGAVWAFGLMFGFNPLWWFCLLLLLAGVLGTSRMLLRIHTLGEIVAGYLVGLFAGFFAVAFF